MTASSCILVGPALEQALLGLGALRGSPARCTGPAPGLACYGYRRSDNAAKHSRAPYDVLRWYPCRGGPRDDRGYRAQVSTRGSTSISTYHKLSIIAAPGERVLVLASAGTLSLSQSVVSVLKEGLENSDTGEIETLRNAPSLFRAVQLVGRAIRRVRAVEGAARFRRRASGPDRQRRRRSAAARCLMARSPTHCSSRSYAACTDPAGRSHRACLRHARRQRHRLRPRSAGPRPPSRPVQCQQARRRRRTRARRSPAMAYRLIRMSLSCAQRTPRKLDEVLPPLPASALIGVRPAAEAALAALDISCGRD